jgi:hypothetical protein
MTTKELPMGLITPATSLQQAVIDRSFYQAAHTAVHLYLAGGQVKQADSVTSYSLKGRLYLSQSGWLLMSVPNALGRGAFDALQEQGVELPTRDTDDPDAVFNAHVSVMNPDEVAKLGGPAKITERGHMMRYTLGPVKEITPGNWNGVSRVWAIEVNSPELKNLRKSYGLTPLPGPTGDWAFHITFAIRRRRVLQPGSVSKAAFDKQANGDMLAFKAWKATGLSDEEADRKAGESLELPKTKTITPVVRNKRIKEEEFEVCPHCNEEIGEKAYYVDEDGYEYHRGCVDKGPIGQLKWAMTATEIDAAAAACEEPKSKEQAQAGNYRHGHCTLHGMPITIETGRGMTRKGTDKDGKDWEITMAHHYGYIKRTESEADGDHIDVFIGPDVDSDTVFVVDQNVDGKFDEHKCMLGFKTEAAAKAGYLACYAKDWKGLAGVKEMTLDEFKEWCKSGDTSKPCC